MSDLRLRTRPGLPFSTWRTRPGHGENSIGYFCRLVAEAGHSSLRVYAKEIGLNGRNLDPQEFLHHLSRLPLDAAEVAGLARATAAVSRSGILLAGNTLWPRWHWRMDRRRYCPACLEESAHHRTWWDIRSYRMCHRHGLAIEDRDPLGRTIDWWWPSFDIGPSGAPLARRAPVAVAPPAFEGYLVGRLGFGPVSLAPLLDGVPLSGAVEAASFVGRILCWNGEGRHPPIVDADTFRAGFDACRGGFDHLVDALSGWLMDRIPEERRKAGLEPTFEWAYRHRPPRRDDRSLVPTVAEAMKAALARHGRVGRMASNALDIEHADSVLQELRARYGCSRPGMRRLLEFAGIEPDRAPGRTALFFDAGAVRRLDGIVESLIPMEEVTAILGIATRAVTVLAEEGLLPRVRGIGTDERAKPRFPRGEVERLLSEAMSRRADRAFASETSFRQFATEAHLTQGQLAVLVLRGEVTPSLRTGSGIGFFRLRFARASLAPFLGGDEVEPPPEADAPATVTQIEAKVVTGLSRSTLLRFEALGMLRRAAPRGARESASYDLDSVLKLADTVAPASLYADVLSVPYRLVVERLAEYGISPFIPPRHGNHETTCFDRRSVRGALRLEHDPDRVPGDPMLELWAALSRAVRSLGNASKIPRTIMAERFHFKDANSNSGFEVFVDRECRTIWMTLVCCPRRSPKRMRWFERNRQAVEALLPGMKSDWSGRVTGTLRISSTDDVGEAALAIDAIARLR